jgi:hypothetical protein
MSFEAGLKTFLNENLSTGNRNYPLKIPQGATLPATTYKEISGNSEYAHDGSSNLVRARYQIDIWGETFASVKEIEGELIAASSGFHGSMGSNVCNVFVERGPDINEPDTDRYRKIVDLIVWRKENA